MYFSNCISISTSAHQLIALMQQSLHPAASTLQLAHAPCSMHKLCTECAPDRHHFPADQNQAAYICRTVVVALVVVVLVQEQTAHRTRSLLWRCCTVCTTMMRLQTSWIITPMVRTASANACVAVHLLLCGMLSCHRMCYSIKLSCTAH